MKLGKNVSTIGASAFANCTSMKKITIPAKTEKLGSKAFTNAGKSNPKQLTVKVPKSKLSAYTKILRQRGLSSKAKLQK